MRKLKLALGAGIFFVIITTILFQRLSKLSKFRIASDSDVPGFRFSKQIDYKMSMQRITQYRLSAYPSNTKYRWLFLTSFRIYRIMMDRHYFAQYYAAKRHPNIDPTLWGRDFPGRSVNETV